MPSDAPPVTIYVVFFFFCLLFSVLINGLFLRFSKTLGIRNTEETIIRWGSQSKPAFGGIAFFIIFLLSTACYAIFFNKENLIHDGQFLGILSATTLAFLMGLADDAYNTRPWLKFGVQIVCGVLLTSSGITIQWFSQEMPNHLLTVFWVVGMMNSINMLDNMDAITTTVAISVVTLALSIMVVTGQIQHLHLMWLLGVLSALLGFLYYNWNPSKMYMGDTGSQFLGIFLAAIGIVFLWNHNLEAGLPGQRLIMTLMAFLLPVSDTTIVFINRLSKRRSPFIGGRDHTTHHLVYLGLKDHHVAVLFWSISTISLILVVLLVSGRMAWNGICGALLTTFVVGTFVTLLTITRRTHEPRHEKSKDVEKD
ncbi:MAG: undecaprenyl/decaprenyl-phosphate alpha-N-acetylglucosaminyl 1-phosphate transferase [Flavobacteriales bacterium]|nr:undecaprenyl/decaprenyl-phosphate alpha-N-acetylglucosaminyl 1-phosphate transferase [Flavobacteriales bacterium]